MTLEEPAGAPLTIGEMARLTQLTPKALRLYDELGLLSPAGVDRRTGYRRYRADQVERGRLIALLRGIEMGLAAIGDLLATFERDRDEAVSSLGRYLVALAYLPPGLERVEVEVDGVRVPAEVHAPPLVRPPSERG